ncbi:MAG: TIGR03960 family B12-binding radical SAM protein [Defluviitaleaceae bacterium]|nr:TIGR03960 family B12-binding radical SAM protein [Defluviitaleaceae bacterium]
MRLDDGLLLEAKGPGRYAGGEYGAVKKDPRGALIRFAYCFPDAYEVGMSNLGLQILYSFINRRPDCYCERAFMPLPDFSSLLRERGVPLYALESKDALASFDIMGFSLQYELNYTNALAMLDLAGLPLKSRERGESFPVVCAGGPCALNPEPMAPFFDFFYIGEGEAALDEVLDLFASNKRRGGSKASFLESIAGVAGIYVPAFYDAAYAEGGELLSFATNRTFAPARVVKAAVADLDDTFYPETFVVSSVEAVHDRAMVEIFRGCSRGCRFCQAGYAYRPVRERSAEKVIECAKKIVDSTGHEEVSLVSLASCDHSGFEKIVDGLLAQFGGRRVNLSLPSLRVDNVSLSVLQKTGEVRKSSLTFAPEAGSQRLRDCVNKNVTEEEILGGCGSAFEAGFDRVKLYFMTGLPTEDESDLLQIARLSERIVDKYYELPYEKRSRPPSVSVSSSCFVPKPFTPFQWAPQDDPETYLAKQKTVKGSIKKKRVAYRYHDAYSAAVEGALSRGGRPVARAIELAYKNGASFDGWTEHFKYDIWEKAFGEAGLDLIDSNSRGRGLDEPLPWDFIDAGVSKDFLRGEYSRAINSETTPGCMTRCARCGLEGTACLGRSDGGGK